METAPLKSFATWARTALIREVTARIAVVLAPSSPERVEQPNAVAALEKAVNAAGGGEPGRAAVADNVAYTWFNRIIALRFMDANGYTGIGVVSPERGREGGQPEVLAEAKRRNIDIMVVTRKSTVEAITGLLNGTRRSDDPQGEAYALLLAAYCRFWNRSMPFMFEREGDYTEPLIPANLLADDSVLARAVAVLTEDVCQDVEVIGWLYQFYISERKEEVFAGFKKNKKASAEEIPAATQLFTPHWIVRYLVENSLGRLWVLNRPTSRLAEQMDYYIAPVDEETDFLKVSTPEELKIIDPACGSGHMLTYAFDLLYAIYEEEGYAPTDIPGLILANNLYGTEIDPRAGALGAFALTMKARARQRTFFNKQVEPNICVLEPISFTPTELDTLVTRGGDRQDEEAFWSQFEHADTFGSLIQPREGLIGGLTQHLEANPPVDGDFIAADIHGRAQRALHYATFLSSGYHLVVANPPYMGTRNMGPALRDFAEKCFCVTQGDLCTMFLERSLELVGRRGLAALITSESWFFNSTYDEMRIFVRGHAQIRVAACIDKSAFGVRLNTVATVLEQEGVNTESLFFRVDAETIKGGNLKVLPPQGQPVYRVRIESFSRVPGGAFIFDMPKPLLALYDHTPTVGDVVDVKQGLATGDNGRFVRFWWEVPQGRIAFGCADREEAARTGSKWFPYNKGGTPVPWWGNQEHVVNWQSDGRELFDARPKSVIRNPQFYFRPLVTWSNIGNNGARFRLIPEGFVFDVAGMSAFPTDESKRLNLLGYLNSSLLRQGLNILAPTFNYQVGDVARLPLLGDGTDDERVRRLVDLAREQWAERETAHEFAINALTRRGRGSLEALMRTESESKQNRGSEIESLERASDEYWTRRIAAASRIDVTSEPRVSTRSQGGETAAEVVEALVSFAVGCMLGRYSLDLPGLIIADQDDTLRDYLAKVPTPSFMPDADNVIPIVDGDWFEDDIVARFRQVLRVAFGEQHFEENLRFVTESLGVKDLRDYFLKSFYKDHVQRYKKRPIYWLFSSPKGSFNALIYMHRYTPSTVSMVLNEYLREFRAKLEASRQHHERVAAAGGTPREKAAAQKEVDRLRKVLLELEEYERDVLYPLATQQVQIDLDDGVKSNYPKLGAALKKIPGLEASDG